MTVKEALIYYFGKAKLYFAKKSEAVTGIAWDNTNHKLTRTVNGTTTDVVTAAALKSGLSLENVTNDAQVKRTEMGAAGGVATLDAAGRIPSSQLPSYVDDVIEGYLSGDTLYEESTHITAISPEAGKIYVDLATNKTYRWSGSALTEISASLALGTTAGTAYAGDAGASLAGRVAALESESVITEAEIDAIFAD